MRKDALKGLGSIAFMTALALSSGAPKQVYASSNNEFSPSKTRDLSLGVAYIEKNCRRLNGVWVTAFGTISSIRLPRLNNPEGLLYDTDQTNHPGAHVVLDGNPGTDFGAFNGQKETIYGEVTYIANFPPRIACRMENAQLTIDTLRPSAPPSELISASSSQRPSRRRRVIQATVY